ncbi:MAG: PIN domain-containing protein [Firmicutes bacterium]|nr:PIN domain-containing protein [Bacillota bacterium]
MRYISSDTNVWIDFVEIDRIKFPFMLPYTYLMSEYTAESELIYPEGLADRLVQLGMKIIEISDGEFYMAVEYIEKYGKISTVDAIALAVAKKREITLMTGDGPLRKAAAKEHVEVIGTIGVLDNLVDENHITVEEYKSCILLLLEKNGGAIRLPEDELLKRLEY